LDEIKIKGSQLKKQVVGHERIYEWLGKRKVEKGNGVIKSARIKRLWVGRKK